MLNTYSMHAKSKFAQFTHNYLTVSVYTVAYNS